MSTLFGILTLFLCVNIISGNDLKRISNITGKVELIEIDSDSNIYATSDAKFYKFNSEHKLILETATDSRIVKVLLTPTKYVWVVTLSRIYLLKPNSTYINGLTNYVNQNEKSRFFMTEGEGNLIYNTDKGVCIFKLEAATPTLILGLETLNVSPENSYLVDRSNNIYFIVRSMSNPSSKGIATVTSNHLKNISPSAKVIAPTDKIGKYMSFESSLITEFYKHIIVAFSGDYARLYTIEKESFSDLKVLFSQPSFNYSNFHPVKDYLYFFGKNDENCYLNLLYLIFNPYVKDSYSYDLKQINRVFEKDLCTSGKILSDSDGNVFFASYRLYRLKAGEIDIDEIDLFNDHITPRATRTDESIMFDFDEEENLWILAKGELYILKQNSSKVDQMTNSLFAKKAIMKMNKAKKQIFIGSESGLYVYSK